jgi:hypothetical protein
MEVSSIQVSKNCLGVLCGLQDHRGGKVEDALDAPDRRPDRYRVEEVHLEKPEPRVRAVQSSQVLRLSLVLCKGNKLQEKIKKKKIKNKLQDSKSIRSSERVQMIWIEERLTEVLDGGMDGVAAVEEEADEPGADEAAAASDADEPAKGTTIVSLCRRRRRHLAGS